MISHTHNEILKQKNFSGSGFEGAPKLWKAFFSRLLLWQNYETLEVPTRAVLRPLIWNLTILLNSKNFSSYHDKTRTLSIAKVLFRGFVCKISTNNAAFQKTLTRFWTINSIKYENVTIGLIKRNTSDLELRKGKTKAGKQGVRSLYLFEITK